MKHLESYRLFKYLLKQQLVRKPVRLLGLHVEDKHVGVAIADLDNAHAEPYCVIHRKDSDNIAQSFLRLIREESVRGILVGVPVLRKEDTADPTQVQEFVKEELPKIAELNDVRLIYWKDILTVSQNVDYLLAPFQLDEKIIEHICKRSVAVILQDYLDYVTSPRNHQLIQGLVLDDM